MTPDRESNNDICQVRKPVILLSAHEVGKIEENRSALFNKTYHANWASKLHYSVNSHRQRTRRSCRPYVWPIAFL